MGKSDSNDLSKYNDLLDMLVAAHGRGKDAVFTALLNKTRRHMQEAGDGDKWPTFINHLIMETKDNTIGAE